MIKLPKNILKKDVKGLEKSKLDPQIIDLIKYARIEARAIKNKIDPSKINSWSDLIEFLEKCLKETRRKTQILRERMKKEKI